MKILKGEKVLLGPSTFAAIDQLPLDCLTATGCEIVDNPYKRKLTKPELIDLLSKGITGVIAGLEPFDREVLERSKLKVISRCGSGLSNVDLTAAKELDIAVCFTPDGPTSAVAELTIGAMLGLLRMIPLMDKDLHQGNWAKQIGMQLEQKTVAVIGWGRIGRKVASLLAPFKVRLLAVDPFIHDTSDENQIVSLDEALSRADIITVHASGEDCIIGEQEFGLMKTGAYLLNAARGGLIDEVALFSAIKEGKIRGAWLDTFDQEPYSGQLTELPQVILTPHVGSYTVECRKSMETEAVENLITAMSN